MGDLMPKDDRFLEAISRLLGGSPLPVPMPSDVLKPDRVSDEPLYILHIGIIEPPDLGTSIGIDRLPKSLVRRSRTEAFNRFFGDFLDVCFPSG